jgi:PIN domain nuclease of toxin-antitoxin system
VILAAILGELSSDQAERWMKGSCVSTVNVAEVFAKLTDKGFPAEAITESIVAMKLDARPLDLDLAGQTGLLRCATRQAGLSLGDRACLALAGQLGLPAATADRAWANVDIGVEIVFIR